MKIAVLLDPELKNSSPGQEIEAIYQQVVGLRWVSDAKHNGQDDRVFMDISGFGEGIYQMFCHKYPDLADRIIPVVPHQPRRI